jgi:hypothetical protein
VEKEVWEGAVAGSDKWASPKKGASQKHRPDGKRVPHESAPNPASNDAGSPGTQPKALRPPKR